MVTAVADKVCCTLCGIPVDAEYFDVSGTLTPAQIPEGEHRVLAAFQLHPQYCGVLLCFAQFTDLYARDNSQIQTPGFEWIILQNGKPLFPYMRQELIVNPWGMNNFCVAIRLDENARVEMAIRRRTGAQINGLTLFAGRLVGRYWYNETFGGRER
jgi:hypothetical protein